MTFEDFRLGFVRLMEAEAGCLHRLQVNVPQFLRPWEEISQDVWALFAVDQNWAVKPPVIEFGAALQDPKCLRARANLVAGAEQVVRLLAAHPGVALERPGSEAPAPGPGRKQRGSLPLDQVNELVMKHLRRHHDARSPEIAKAIGCSEAAVRKTAAWKAVSHRRKAQKEGPRAGDRSPKVMDEAEYRTALEEHRREEEARTLALDGQDSAGDEGSGTTNGYQDDGTPGSERTDPEAERARLIAQQAKELRRDQRRSRRGRRS
jgi:hypothetical protein